MSAGGAPDPTKSCSESSVSAVVGGASSLAGAAALALTIPALRTYRAPTVASVTSPAAAR
jgi:hypothetical protein